MFDNLDELLKLTKQLEATNSTSDETAPEDLENEDISAFYYDGGMGTDKYTDDTAEYAIIKGTSEKDNSTKIASAPETSAPIAGSSGNANPDAEPLVEDRPTDDTLDKVMDEGLGIRGSMKKAFHAFECADACANKYKIGDTIKMNGGKTPVIFVVKSADGDMITAAKPTDAQGAKAIAHSGKWPEFYFRQDEISPMKDLAIDSLEKIMNIIAFNDRPEVTCTLTNGTCVDESPMKDAQEYVKTVQFDHPCEDSAFARQNDVWNEMFGVPCTDRSNCIEHKDNGPKVAIQDITGSSYSLDDMLKGGYFGR